MTKDEVSDVQSLILRVRECALVEQAAMWALKEADRQLQNWLSIHTEREGAKQP